MNLSFREWFDRNVRGLPEHKVGQEGEKDQFHPCKEDDQEDFRAVCPECQRLINPFEHVCEGLQPRFYLEDLVDWEECPPHANWAAQDVNGVIWFYESKPFLDAASGRWIGEGDTWYTYSVALAIDWKKPLPRPN